MGEILQYRIQCFEAIYLFCSSASRPYYINNGYCTHLCLLNPFGYRCVCPDKEDDRPCSTVPALPTTTAVPTIDDRPRSTVPALPTTTAVPTIDDRPLSTVPALPTTTAVPTVDYCANPDTCQHEASCSISRDSTLGYECECEGYFFGTNCERVLGKLPQLKLVKKRYQSRWTDTWSQSTVNPLANVESFETYLLPRIGNFASWLLYCANFYPSR